MKPPTFAELVAQAARSSGLPRAHVRRAAKHLLKFAFEACWTHGHAELPGYLTLRTGMVKARKLRNPVSGETMELPAARVMAARVTRRWRRR